MRVFGSSGNVEILRSMRMVTQWRDESCTGKKHEQFNNMKYNQ